VLTGPDFPAGPESPGAAAVMPWLERSGRRGDRVLEPRRSGGLSLAEGAAVAIVAVAAVVIAFAVLSAIAGIAWFFIKLAVVVAVIALVVRLVVGRR
jgi:hypothetical protein